VNKHATEVPASAVADLHPDHEHITQHRRAKIVCTMGPATNNESVIRDLMHAGMDVARLNFSLGRIPNTTSASSSCAARQKNSAGLSASCKTCKGRRSVPDA
jgi:hypothetical protein